MATANPPSGLIQQAKVTGNRVLCRDHLRLTMNVDHFAVAEPGQFVHLCPGLRDATSYRVVEESPLRDHQRWSSETAAPLIRRAFSIAGLRRIGSRVELDVMYHVVGTATRWLQSLTVGSSLNVLGPLGNEFPISARKRHAWLVSGGVGLPPMLWLAQSLSAAGRSVVAFCGARTIDLLPLSLSTDVPAAASAESACLTAREFSEFGVPVVISSDDGSIGFRGHVGAALMAYHRANPSNVEDLVVYTCGPERMMHFVADHCTHHGIECHCCMERSMACGTGTCQSCVLPVHDARDADGWSYRLCCTDGPVFPAHSLVWNVGQSQHHTDVGAQ